jgi:hypothetical protein
VDPGPTPDPAISSVTFKTATKFFFSPKLFSYYFLKLHLHHFSRLKELSH